MPVDTVIDEAERYNAIRLRLLNLAQHHPWLLDVTIAVEGRKCIHCGKVGGVVEHPADHFLCNHCGESWANYHMGSR